jgi:hypothetical protein
MSSDHPTLVPQNLPTLHPKPPLIIRPSLFLRLLNPPPHLAHTVLHILFPQHRISGLELLDADVLETHIVKKAVPALEVSERVVYRFVFEALVGEGGERLQGSEEGEWPVPAVRI